MFVTAGGMRIDYLITHAGEARVEMVRGNGLYAAVGAALWGEPVHLWARLGRNYPQAWLDPLTSHQIGIDGLVRLDTPQDHRTFFAYLPDGRRQDTNPAAHFARIGQPLPAALLAMRLRGNVPMAMAACWVTNPFTLPAILYIQFELGKWLRETLSVPMPHFLTAVKFVAPGVGEFNAASFVLGMMISGVLLALLAYPLVHLFSAVLPHHLPVRRRRKAGVAKPTAPATPEARH